MALLVGCRAASRQSIAGSYYRGDGTGYNINLSLLDDGAYKAEWHGCMGLYGAALGVWIDDGEHVLLFPSVEAGLMQGHLRQLDVVQRGAGAILLPANDRDFYYDHGVSAYSCFQRTEALQ